ncbi:MAG: lmo0937 family membrane protein [Balneolaceae bacterium]
MGNILYVIAVILVIIWAIGFVGFEAGPFIHFILIIAASVMLFNIFSEKKMLHED